jgi:hypothetical protein
MKYQIPQNMTIHNKLLPVDKRLFGSHETRANLEHYIGQFCFLKPAELL